MATYNDWRQELTGAGGEVYYDLRTREHDAQVYPHRDQWIAWVGGRGYLTNVGRRLYPTPWEAMRAAERAMRGASP